MNYDDDYGETFAQYDTSPKANIIPILSWDFHYELLNELKKYSFDLKRIQQIAHHFKWDTTDLKIKTRLQEEVIVITNLEQKIVFASNGILKMTGYKEAEILGKKPKTFQGPQTSLTDLKEIRTAIKKQKPFEKTIVNYKKNGELYNCKITCFPVFNLNKEITHFIAFEKVA
ncbi:PAS domain-containing protein [Flavobacterium sp. GA093]|uniref:PAS domain-containing protein n=1 Tax=Flavobacterium hydrocarbonoxydans TaxID=2683249 RepID=A0A6I4NXX1_9FLAO|nr:PAS domain-containing protein [Flavobacterium hydrocarbonoxydans]MWB96599.1 PAS domain-containing protein [Flavobacterium hydrocarbonoxydans]